MRGGASPVELPRYVVRVYGCTGTASLPHPFPLLAQPERAAAARQPDSMVAAEARPAARYRGHSVTQAEVQVDDQHQHHCAAELGTPSHSCTGTSVRKQLRNTGLIPEPERRPRK